MEILLKYFPELTPRQIEKFIALKPLYEDWNSKINVISRKDMDNFYLHHVLHSLAIAKIISFEKGTKIIDVGTGGGFPGIPLAIMFPETEFYLVDSIGKKIKVVEEVVKALQLKNIWCKQARVEEISEKFDFVVSRAVTSFDKFLPWVKNKFLKESMNALPNGILYLKGGDLEEELQNVNHLYIEFEIETFFEEEFFEAKKVVYIDMITK